MNIFDWHEDKTPEELAKELGISDLSVVDNAGKEVVKNLEKTSPNSVVSNTIFTITSHSRNISNEEMKNNKNWVSDYLITDLAIWMLCKRWGELIRIKDIKKKSIVISTMVWYAKTTSLEKFHNNASILLPDYNYILELKNKEIYGKYNVLWSSDFHINHLNTDTIMKKKWKQEILFINNIDWYTDMNSGIDEKCVVFQKDKYTYNSDELKDVFQIIREDFIEEIGLSPSDIIENELWTCDFDFSKLELGIRVKWNKFQKTELFRDWMTYLWKITTIQESIIQIQWDNEIVETYNKKDLKTLWIQFFDTDLEWNNWETKEERNTRESLYYKRANRLDIRDLWRWMKLKKKGSNVSVKIIDVNIEIWQILTLSEMWLQSNFNIESFNEIHSVYKDDLQVAKKDSWFINLDTEDINNESCWTILSNMNNVPLWVRVKIDWRLGKVYDIVYDKNRIDTYTSVKIKRSNNSESLLLMNQFKYKHIEMYSLDDLNIPYKIEEVDNENYWERKFALYDIERWYLCKAITTQICYCVLDIDEDSIRIIWLDQEETTRYSWEAFHAEFTIYKKSINMSYTDIPYEDDVPF